MSALIHGHARPGKESGEYRSWGCMLARCLNPNDDHYARYGARGLTVCKAWRESFQTFLADMGPKPSPQHTLNRKENSGNYEPGNVEWALPIDQARNRRNNRVLVLNGESRCLSEWAEAYSINVWTLTARLNRGIPLEMALTLPLSPGKRGMGVGPVARPEPFLLRRTA